MPDESPMDSIERQRQSVLPDQLIAQLLDPEPPVSAKGQNEGLLISEDLLGSQTMRTPTVLQKTCLAIRLIPAPPLAQCGTRDAAATANQSGIPCLCIKLDPGETRLRQIHGSPSPSAVELWTGLPRCPQLRSNNRLSIASRVGI